MIHLLVHSHDTSLQFALTRALGADFSVVQDRRMDAVREVVSQRRCDVLMLDLDSAYCPMHQQMAFLEEIRALGTPVVVMTSDGDKTMAMDLVQRGRL